MEAAQYRPVRITAIKQEAPHVKTFTLAAIDGLPIPYAAGQFLTFVFNRHGHEERRSFSFSSSPVIDEQLSVTLKRVANGAWSRYFIDDARVGDVLQTTGAAGLFTLPADAVHYHQVFFFAAGIGITPVYSLIKTILHTQPHLQVVLVYSNSAREEAVFYDELKTLLAQYPSRLKIEFLFSNAFNLSRARLSKWLLPALLKEYAEGLHNDTLFYLCGPFTYMRMVVITLEELGIPAGNVKKENFDTSRPVQRQMPPDTQPHRVTLHYNNGAQQTITCTYPDTILQSARLQGIALPYSCEAGRCGSCAALCTNGKIWLSYNEVLTEKDLAVGRTLTCVGHPIGGDADLYL